MHLFQLKKVENSRICILYTRLFLYIFNFRIWKGSKNNYRVFKRTQTSNFAQDLDFHWWEHCSEHKNENYFYIFFYFRIWKGSKNNCRVFKRTQTSNFENITDILECVRCDCIYSLYFCNFNFINDLFLYVFFHVSV